MSALVEEARGAEATEATEATEAIEAIEVIEVIEATEAIEVIEVIEATEVTEVTECCGQKSRPRQSKSCGCARCRLEKRCLDPNQATLAVLAVFEAG